MEWPSQKRLDILPSYRGNSGTVKNYLAGNGYGGGKRYIVCGFKYDNTRYEDSTAKNAIHDILSHHDGGSRRYGNLILKLYTKPGVGWVTQGVREPKQKYLMIINTSQYVDTSTTDTKYAVAYQLDGSREIYNNPAYMDAVKNLKPGVKITLDGRTLYLEGNQLYQKGKTRRKVFLKKYETKHGHFLLDDRKSNCKTSGEFSTVT